MRRLAAVLAATTVLAIACGADDEPVFASLTVNTTVPQVTVAADGAEGLDRAESGDAEPSIDEPAEAAAATAGRSDAADTAAFRRVDLTIERVVELESPIDAVVAPNGEWWIAERAGRVIVVDPDSGTVGDTVLDLDDEASNGGERGLLGLAVDDDALYVNYTDRQGDTRIEAFLLDETGRPGQRVVLLTLEQPFGNHNGGALAIGPDGHLYVGVGDGGGSGDPLGAGQDPGTALGSILRIDPTPAAPGGPYAIPTDNPFADGGGIPEAFLIGVRNPWRMSFDSATGDFWIADVGQDRWEEVTLLLGANGWGLGANLGWNLREGTEAFRGERPEGNVDPVFVYSHTGEVGGCSITGGEVYRGDAIPGLVGAYVFGDYCTSDVWAISVASGEVVFVDLDISMPGGNLVDFSVDPNGEMVALSLSGAVVRLMPA